METMTSFFCKPSCREKNGGGDKKYFSSINLCGKLRTRGNMKINKIQP